MTTDFQNNCENPKTFELYDKFKDNPHVIGMMMYQSEEDNLESELVEITFKHYIDIITVVFNSSTNIGEVMLHVMGDNIDGVEDETEYVGVITVSKLEALLKSIPHISNFMEDVNESGVLH